jgi:hypothetical protein
VTAFVPSCLTVRLCRSAAWRKWRARDAHVAGPLCRPASQAMARRSSPSPTNAHARVKTITMLWSVVQQAGLYCYKPQICHVSKLLRQQPTNYKSFPSHPIHPDYSTVHRYVRTRDASKRPCHAGAHDSNYTYVHKASHASTLGRTRAQNPGSFVSRTASCRHHRTSWQPPNTPSSPTRTEQQRRISNPHASRIS